MNKENKTMYFEIATYVTLREQPKLFIDILQNNICPLMRKFSDFDQKLIFNKKGTNLDYRFMKYTDKNLLKLFGNIRSSDVYNVEISVWNGSTRIAGFFINSDEGIGERRYADNIRYGLLEKLIFAELRVDLIDCFLKIAEAVNAETGHIEIKNISMPDCTTQPTTLELVNDLKYRTAAPDFDKYVRGYFWGNWISMTQISILGGVDFVLKNAPADIKKIYKNGIYLQLTKNGSDLTDSKLRELKLFFKPILRSHDEEVKKRWIAAKEKFTDVGFLSFD